MVANLLSRQNFDGLFHHNFRLCRRAAEASSMACGNRKRMEPGTHAQFTPSGSQLQEGLLTSPKMAWASDLRATPKENFQIRRSSPGHGCNFTSLCQRFTMRRVAHAAIARDSQLGDPVLARVSRLELPFRFAGTRMRRVSFLVLIVAFATLTWSESNAAGSFQTRPAFQTTATTTGTATVTPTVSPSATDLIGCGRGRIRDPHTHTCRGPADIR